MQPDRFVSTHPLHLPRTVESDPRFPRIISILTTNTCLLWPGGELQVPAIKLTDELAAAVRDACSRGKLVRGLEGAQHRLAGEQRGLILSDRRSGVQRGSRVSRLLLLADDGADRFYRAVESLLRNHGPRLLAVRLEVNAATLGEMLYGPDSVARLIMIEHKDAVSNVLLALAGQVELASSGNVETKN